MNTSLAVCLAGVLSLAAAVSDTSNQRPLSSGSGGDTASDRIRPVSGSSDTSSDRIRPLGDTASARIQPVAPSSDDGSGDSAGSGSSYVPSYSAGSGYRPASQAGNSYAPSNGYAPSDNSYAPSDNSYSPGTNSYAPSGYADTNSYDNPSPSYGDNTPSGYGDNSNSYDNTNPSYDNTNDGYGNPSPSYGHGFNTGYGQQGYANSGYGYRGYASPTRFKAYVVHLPTKEGPPDELDRAFFRVEAVRDQVKTAEEQFRAYSSRQALQKAFLDNIAYIVLPRLDNQDLDQDDVLDRLELLLADLENAVSSTLTASLSDLVSLNQQNQAEVSSVEGDITNAEVLQVSVQAAAIARLLSDVTTFRDTVIQVADNALELVSVEQDGTRARVDDILAIESSRRCEAGRVSLDADERRVDYQYQLPFSRVPQVTASLCGFNFDIDTFEDPFGFLRAIANYNAGLLPVPNAYGGYSHANPAPPAEPNTIGVNLAYYSSREGLILEGFDLSLGDTKAVDIKVCFLACSIGPGINVQH